MQKSRFPIHFWQMKPKMTGLHIIIQISLCIESWKGRYERKEDYDTRMVIKSMYERNINIENEEFGASKIKQGVKQRRIFRKVIVQD